MVDPYTVSRIANDVVCRLLDNRPAIAAGIYDAMVAGQSVAHIRLVGGVYRNIGNVWIQVALDLVGDGDRNYGRSPVEMDAPGTEGSR